MLRSVSFAFAIVFALASFSTPAGAAIVDPIQPGDIVNTNAGQCTLNFAFDGQGSLAGKVFIGTAAHCVIGVTGQLVSTTGSANFGRVFWTGDYSNSVNGGTAVENGIPGTQLDFTLIEVLPAFVPRVIGEVAGHPGMPNGFTTSPTTSVGDLILCSGYGTGFSSVRATRENRTGALNSDTATSYTAWTPTVFGDSGGPLVHESGKAFGIVSGSTIGLPWGYWSNGPTVQGVVTELAGLGISVTLRNA
jgi:hypothetical protein